MRKFGLTILTLALMSCAVSSGEGSSTQKSAKAATRTATKAEAQAFIDKANAESAELGIKVARAYWLSATHITHDTTALAAAAGEESQEFSSRLVEESKRFSHLELDGELGRAMNFIRIQNTMPAPNTPEGRAELSQISVDLGSMYGKGKYCKDDGSCMTLGDLSAVLATSRDYDELEEAWIGWRTISRQMRPLYERFTELTKEGANELGFDDLGALWKSGYDMDADEFETVAEDLWLQVKPLYDQLHCHVRAALADEYGKDKVALDQPIPAHLLGNMWAQSWGNVYPLVEPFPGEASLDVTKSLVDQGYDAVRMTKRAEDFFMSLGMPALPESFYERSMLTKPRDREVQCHASAWPMDGKDDVRIKMCIEPNSEELYTIYHELGHIYYYLMYRDQPPMFKGGAHDGFHEAIGDTIVLSMTPDYLQSIGLVGDVKPNERVVINQQMLTALDKIAFLPFGKLIDQWRWDVFSGKTSPQDYNAAWWEQRTQYQGIKPPVERSEADFDPGAKYHIPGNTPYTRYFLSFILQFQFHKSLCEEAGFDGPLHECSIYNNKAAGEKFMNMLRLGQSRPWQDSLEQLTGSREMDASAIIEYFQPLMGYLKEQNVGRSCGW
ncbi:MAG: M2 family metallopeptidase [Gammaproteobacteria bacterium]